MRAAEFVERIKFQRETHARIRPTPALGQDTAEVLAELDGA